MQGQVLYNILIDAIGDCYPKFCDRKAIDANLPKVDPSEILCGLNYIQDRGLIYWKQVSRVPRNYIYRLTATGVENYIDRQKLTGSFKATCGHILRQIEAGGGHYAYAGKIKDGLYHLQVHPGESLVDTALAYMVQIGFIAEGFDEVMKNKIYKFKLRADGMDLLSGVKYDERIQL